MNNALHLFARVRAQRAVLFYRARAQRAYAEHFFSDGMACTVCFMVRGHECLYCGNRYATVEECVAHQGARGYLVGTRPRRAC